MNLLVDIGNSNFKWSFSNGTVIDKIQRFSCSREAIGYRQDICV